MLAPSAASGYKQAMAAFPQQRNHAETSDPSAKEAAVNTVDLVVMACTLADPSACREYHLLFQSEGSLQNCIMQAQPYLAQWAEEHPRSRVVRWHCAWPDREDEKS